MTIAPWEAERMQRALGEIRDIASGSTTANSLPNIARIASNALEPRPQFDDRHAYVPHRKWPWFCDRCGYPEHENLKHT